MAQKGRSSGGTPGALSESDELTGPRFRYRDDDWREIEATAPAAAAAGARHEIEFFAHRLLRQPAAGELAAYHDAEIQWHKRANAAAAELAAVLG
ncbi:MAG TPA: hypothetical protein VGN97_10165 [Mesorhizobium sp.]|jgi:hypothetical protein|nr:hypothetical protein [Mesorhizobium sp.]